VSAPALALSFFDAAHDIHGTSRAGATILFEGRKRMRQAEQGIAELVDVLQPAPLRSSPRESSFGKC
jgi:hypothetical protein